MFIEKMHGMANTKVAKFILGLITVSFFNRWDVWLFI